MKKLIGVLGVLVLVLATVIGALPVQATDGFGYDNYMQSLAITSAPTSVVAGDTVTVVAAVRANTDVDVHFEFKGHFAWGDWVYDSTTVLLTDVDPTVTYNPNAGLTVPVKAILDAEAGTTFYYYVYVTLPGDPWNSAAWGVTSPVVVSPPPSSAGTIGSLIAQLKWEVSNSPLDDGMKTSLLAKLDVASDMVVKGKYKTAYNTLGAFINELQSSNAAAMYSDSVSWVNWIAKAQFIHTLLTDS